METDNKPDITQYLEFYQQLLEEKEGWGPITTWRFSQFRNLSNELKKSTGVSVSYITLTRILQSKDFKRSPQVTTLNALAKHLDFENWAAFCDQYSKQNLKADANSTPSIPKENTHTKPSQKQIIALSTLLSVVVLCFLYALFNGKDIKGAGIFTDSVDESVVSLQLLSELTEVPGRLIFKYKVPTEGFYFGLCLASYPLDSTLSLSANLRGLKPLELNDSIIILNKEKSMFPGPYCGVIFKDDKVVKRLPFNFATKDWATIVLSKVNQRKGKPSFPIILSSLRDDNGNLTIPKQLAEDIRMSYMEKRFKVNYFLAKDFELDANRMRFETRLKAVEPYNALGCKHIRISLLTTHNMIEIPLVQSLCSNMLKLWVSEVVIANNYRAEVKNLKQYHRESLDWEHIAIETEDNVASVYWNRQLIDQIEYAEPLGDLAAIRIRFDGFGVIDFVKVENALGETVYADDFIHERAASTVGIANRQ